jgi:hypothetical protein
MMFEFLGSYIVSAIVIGLVVINFWGLIVFRRFIARFKAAHKDAWLRMGSPELVNPENSSQGNCLFFFIVLGKFFSYNDEELSRNGLTLQVIFIASLAGLAVLFVSLR